MKRGGGGGVGKVGSVSVNASRKIQSGFRFILVSRDQLRTTVIASAQGGRADETHAFCNVFVQSADDAWPDPR